MSYNNIKISTKEQSSNGNVNLNLEDVTNVSNPIDGQTLNHNGVSWISDNANIVQSSDDIFHSTKVANLSTYNTSSPMFLDYPPLGSYSRVHFWFKSTGSGLSRNFTQVTNTTNDASLVSNLNSVTEEVFYKIVFNTAGVYRVFAKIVLSDTYGASGSSVEVQWANKDYTTIYGPRFRIQRNTDNCKPLICVVNAVANQELCLYQIALNGSPNYPFGSSFEDYLVVLEKLE
jgi:hypothetical protein